MALTRVFIANRGEIAARIIRSCKALGIEAVLGTSEADRDSLPARMADRVVCIGPAAAAKSYLDRKAVVAAALGTKADALHPGYGFLAESPELASLCAANGITFVGPKPDQIQKMGNKLQARALARKIGVPTLPGSEKIASADDVVGLIDRIGLPVMLKAAAGGGGRGMKIITNRNDARGVFQSASAEARSSFGEDTLYMERYIANARHIEVQILGDRFGNVVHLGERDCSLQRRHQKLVEEAPAPAISEALRFGIRDAALVFARSIGYESAGTVEFIVDQDTAEFYFLEMNTRIQVEHPVTEMITGIDLVGEQLRIASGERLGFSQADIVFSGHALECRITAELPYEDFRPNPGRISRWHAPQGEYIRLDTHCHEGYVVPVLYDSLMGKLIAHGTSRDEAIERMTRAITEFSIEGVGTTLPFHQAVMANSSFRQGLVHTRLVEQIVTEMKAPA